MKYFYIEKSHAMCSNHVTELFTTISFSITCLKHDSKNPQNYIHKWFANTLFPPTKQKAITISIFSILNIHTHFSLITHLLQS